MLGSDFRMKELDGARLKPRAALLAERLGQKPPVSIPNARQSWEKMATYHFLDSKEVRCETMRAPRWPASQARIAIFGTGACCAKQFSEAGSR